MELRFFQVKVLRLRVSFTCDMAYEYFFYISCFELVEALPQDLPSERTVSGVFTMSRCER